MQILLGVTLLFAALWFVALRPKSSAGGEAASAPAPVAQATPAAASGAAPGVEGLESAVEEAHGAVASANGDAARQEHSTADRSAPVAVSKPAAVSERAAKSHGARGAVRAHRHAASSQVRAVQSALRHHKAVVIAFVDPHTADARAVAQEVRNVSHFGGRAVTLAVPISQLSSYAFITSKVEVTVAPTVVIVDPHRSATTIVGFTDRGEIEQRLADALAVKPHA